MEEMQLLFQRKPPPDVRINDSWFCTVESPNEHPFVIQKPKFKRETINGISEVPPMLATPKAEILR